MAFQIRPSTFNQALRAIGLAGAVGALSLSTACHFGDDTGPLQIVGRDRSGSEVRLPFASRVAAGQLVRSLRRLDQSTVALIQSGEVSGGFELNRVTVGFELELESGFANVVELGAEGALELRYERLPL
jgi:hypothetical protein